MFVKGSPEYYMQVARHEWIKKNIQGLKPSCVVIKTSQDCNLRCKYCYAEGGKQKESIHVRTVLTLFDQLVVNNNSDIDCVFHGGEPPVFLSGAGLTGLLVLDAVYYTTAADGMQYINLHFFA